jgi:hypothetical protein
MWMNDIQKTIAEIQKTLQYRYTSSLYDAEYRANHEKWIRFLLSELDREREENRKLREERDKYKNRLAEVEDESANAMIQMREESRKLREERDKLIEGLRWYADKKNWEYKTSYLDQDAPVLDDCGQRARDIIARYTPTERGDGLDER